MRGGACYCCVVATTTHTAVELLDQVYSLAQLETFDVDAVVARLAEQISGCPVEQVDEQIRAALSAVDALTSRAMRIRLDHALVDDTAVPRQFRTYLAAQVFEFAADLDLLRARARQVVGDDAVAAAIVAAADRVLATRAALRQGIIGLVPETPPEEPEAAPAAEPDVHFFDNIELD